MKQAQQRPAFWGAYVVRVWTVATIVAFGLSVPATGDTSQLRLISELKAADVTVYYPRYVPARFTLSSVEKTLDRAGPWWIRPRPNPPPLRHNYVLHYCDGLRRCFSIESITWVDEDGCLGKQTRVLPGRSRYFGVLEVCSTSRKQKPDYWWLQADAAMSAWLRSNAAAPPAKRSHTGPPIRLRFYSFHGTAMTDREAVAIVESLTPLR